MNISTFLKTFFSFFTLSKFALINKFFSQPIYGAAKANGVVSSLYIISYYFNVSIIVLKISSSFSVKL